jgi:Na+/H+ antiporter NhaD/arsenite permease-like protein
MWMHAPAPDRAAQPARLAASPWRTAWLIGAFGFAGLRLIGLYASGVLFRELAARQGVWHLLPEAAALSIFGATYLVIAMGRLPGWGLDRPGAALVGASLMVALGILPLPAAYQTVDFDTITLLLGMMIVVASLRLSGFFRLVSAWVVTRARHPIVLLASVTLVSGLLSAFLVNDTICLVLTPLVLDLVTRLRRNPIPYLLAIAMASNIGSAATLTGNPQNMIIGNLSHIPYRTFAAALSPVAGIGLLLTIALIALVYRPEFWTHETLRGESEPACADWPVILKSVLVSLAMVGGFFAGHSPALVAILGGSFLLLTRGMRAEAVYAEIDWTLLLMFAGLFIVIAGVERSVLSPEMIAAAGRIPLERLPVLTIVTAFLSNLVSNVPAVLALKPFVASFKDPQHAWLTIAMASTLAGNFTVVGSVANLIVVQRARAQGIDVRFWEYFKVGAPLTVLTILVAVLWLGR